MTRLGMVAHLIGGPVSEDTAQTTVNVDPDEYGAFCATRKIYRGERLIAYQQPT